MSFDEYATKVYPEALRVIADDLRYNTALPKLEAVVLRLMHLQERSHLEIPSTPEGDAFRRLAAKACNESIGFIGSLRAGSLWAALHHTRAILELLAGTHHLICRPTSQAKRFERFAAYPDLLMWQRHLRDRKKVERRQVTEEQYETEVKFISQFHIDRLTPPPHRTPRRRGSRRKARRPLRSAARRGRLTATRHDAPQLSATSVGQFPVSVAP